MNEGKNVERTLIIVKPDAVQRGLTGQVIHRFERRGLRIVAMKFMQMTNDLAQRHYAVHKGKPFYEPLVDYITSGPVVVMVLEGKNAIQIARRTMGATNPAEADPGTIRADLAVEIGRNLVHGSDGPETAVAEISTFFEAREMVSWKRELERWISEDAD
jgi:nucleoside-diphosphate kinase